MDKIKNTTLIGIIVAVLVLGILFPRTSNVPVSNSSDFSETNIANIANLISSRLGALVGPDIPYPYISVGGLRMPKQHISMTTSSSTLCVSNKTTATSTVRVSGVLASSTSTLAFITIEDTTIPFAPPTGAATSTLRGEVISIAADTLGAFSHYATSSQTLAEALDRNGVIGPNKYVVVRADGNGIINTAAGAGKGQVYDGTCNFEFTEL